MVKIAQNKPKDIAEIRVAEGVVFGSLCRCTEDYCHQFKYKSAQSNLQK